jgi:antigen flippase
MALGIGGSIITARVLGPHGRGVIAAALVWANLAGVIVQCGLPQALVFMCSQRPSRANRYLVAGMLISIGQAALIVLTGTFMWGNAAAGTIWFASALMIASQLCCTHIAALVQGLQRWTWFHGQRIAAATAYPLAVVIVTLRPEEPTPTAIIMTAALISAVVAVCGTAVLLLNCRPAAPGATEYADVLHYGRRAYLANIANYMNGRLDQLVLSLFLPSEMLGYYAVAVSISSPLLPIAAGFGSVAFSRIAAAGPGRQGVKQLAGTALASVATITGVVAAVLFASAPFVIPIVFGHRFRPATYPALVLIPGAWLLGRNCVLSEILRGLGRPTVVAFAEVAGAGVTVVALLSLIPLLGLLGAAVASLLSYAAAHAFLLRGLRNEDLCERPVYA